MYELLALLVGCFVGYNYRLGHDAINYIRNHNSESKKDIGVTPGLYHQANENKTQEGEVGFVTPKTPQLLEFEEEERLKELQHSVNVRPK